MKVLRLRNNAAKAWDSISRGSSPEKRFPFWSRPAAFITDNLPKRRGSTKRSSRPDASRAMRWVCLAISASGAATSSLPVIPRCTIQYPARSFPGPRLRSITMCFPALCTRSMRAPSSNPAIARAEDLSGSGLLPIQTDSITSPVTRLANPRAMVSTSGSSGMEEQFSVSGSQFSVGCADVPFRLRDHSSAKS